MKLQTKTLDEALSKLLLVAEKTTLDPMTSIVSFFNSNNKLVVCATDKSNTLYYELDCDKLDDVCISVSIFALAKLIHSLKADEVELNAKTNMLIVKSGGTYKFASVVDGKGKNIMINDRRLHSKNVVSTIDSDSIKALKSSLSISLAPNDFVVADYKDYYMDNANVLTTDTDNASIFRKGFMDNAYKVSAKTVNILAGLNDDFELIHEDSLSAFKGTKCELVTKLLPVSSCPDFQAELFVDVFNKPINFSVQLDRAELLAVLSRCAIFTDGQIELDFSDQLTIKTVDSSLIEKIKSSMNVDKKLVVKLSTLTSYVKTLNDDMVCLEFDETDSLLKICDSQIEHILSSYT